MRIVGLDLALTSAHRAVVLDDQGEFRTPTFTVTTDPASLQRLLTRARTGAPADEPVAVAMEPTGAAWQPIAIYLAAQGATVYIVNSRQVAALRRCLSRFAKSDRIDARVLARAVWLGHRELQPWQCPPAAIWNLQRLCRDHEHLTQQTTCLKNQLLSLDRPLWGDAWAQLFTDPCGPLARWARTEFYNPAVVCALGSAAIRAAWQAAHLTGGRADWPEQLVARAAERLTLYGANFDFAALQAQADRYQGRLAFLEAELRELGRQIKSLLAEVDPHHVLESLYGVGADGAAVYWSHFVDPQRFRTAKQCRSWSGMVPQSAQSGHCETKGLGISRAGPGLIKKYLYLNAEIARRGDPQLAALYYRQRVDKGQTHTEAVCAVATHLLDRLLVIAKEQRPYELRDVDGRPVTVQEARRIILERYTVPPDVRQRQTKRNRRLREEDRLERLCLAADHKIRRESARSR